jgi:C4-type Zn-finger protein
MLLLIKIQTQNFIPYFGYVIMYTYICIFYNKIWTSFLNQK